MDQSGHLKFKTAIFDVNGVLIDSNRANARAMGEAFASAENPAVRSIVEEVYLQLTGIDRGSKIRIIQDRVLGRPFAEGELQKRWDSFKELSRRSMREAPLVPGGKELLAELGERKVLRVALSNTPLAELMETLDARSFASLLDVVRGGGDWPKSESLLRLVKELEIAPESCIFFGDGKGDLEAAKLAGTPFAAIDPGLGEFDNEEGFDGPYENLADWRRRAKVMGPAK